MLDDRPVLAAMGAAFGDAPDVFDRFAAGVRYLGKGDHAAAGREFTSLESTIWWVAASVLQALALAAAGQFRPAIALTHRVSDFVKARQIADDPTGAAGDATLLRQAVRCLYLAEADFPPATGALNIAPLFRSVISYPRSGSTFLLQFLSYAFGVPVYSVYPAVLRYFSRRFYDPAPGHAVFIKDHILKPEYLADEILFPIRDGRNSIVSLARYLYAEGSHNFVRRGELASFISFVATHMPYGFWATHTKAVLDARDRGARIRLVRYEEIFDNFPALLALARELSGGAPVLYQDETEFAGFVAREKRRISTQPEWSEGIALPEDSFIPPNWSIGGGTIDWRSAFDAPARRCFHELGGTEMLIRLGYESDEDWWRHA